MTAQIMYIYWTNIEEGLIYNHFGNKPLNSWIASDSHPIYLYHSFLSNVCTIVFFVIIGLACHTRHSKIMPNFCRLEVPSVIA